MTTKTGLCKVACRPGGALSWAAFPVSMTAGVAFALTILRAGGSEELALVAPTLGLVLLLIVLERTIAWEPAWRRARGDVPTDVAHAFATVLLAPLIQGAVIATMPAIDGWLSSSPWLALQVALVVLLGDLGPYVYHRLSHEKSPLLFRIHVVHHAPTRLYWLNAFRVHPVNLAANTVLRLLPGILLGASHEALLIAGLVSSFVNVWAHANVDVRLGVLDWIVSGPALHRVHHHEDPTTSQSNYGAVTILWDVLFGTRRAPRDVRDGEVGVGDATPPEGWLSQLLYPFGLRCCA